MLPWVSSYKWTPQLYVSYVFCQQVIVTHAWLLCQQEMGSAA